MVNLYIFNIYIAIVEKINIVHNMIIAYEKKRLNYNIMYDKMLLL